MADEINLFQMKSLDDIRNNSKNPILTRTESESNRSEDIETNLPISSVIAIFRSDFDSVVKSYKLKIESPEFKSYLEANPKAYVRVSVSHPYMRYMDGILTVSINYRIIVKAGEETDNEEEENENTIIYKLYNYSASDEKYFKDSIRGLSYFYES